MTMGSNRPLPRATLKKLFVTSAVPGAADTPASRKCGWARPLIWQLAQLSFAFAACPPSNVGTANNARPLRTSGVSLAKQVAGCSVRSASSAPGAVQRNCSNAGGPPAGVAATPDSSAANAVSLRMSAPQRSSA